MNISRVKGMPDYLFSNASLYTNISEIFLNITKSYGYSIIQTPILEKESLFKVSLGETSDVVSKEMYAFTDKGGEEVVLRPEGTAPVVRSFIENGLHLDLPCKLAYFGPMFRYERPQKGRFRQFYQFGVECFGGGAERDAESILLAYNFLKRLNIGGELVLEISTLGDTESRMSYTEQLKQYLLKNKANLSTLSQERLLKNPLRVLDSKEPEDIAVVKSAPKIMEYLNKASQKFFDEVLSILAKFGIKFEINQNIVRGLDYYTHTVFEFKSSILGAQSTLLAGGNYSNFVSLMGGSDVSGVGWATSFERLLLVSNLQDEIRPVVVVLSDCLYSCIDICQKLRSNCICAEFIVDDSFKKSMKKSMKYNPDFVIFIGENERNNNIVTVKNMKTTFQKEWPISICSDIDFLQKNSL